MHGHGKYIYQNNDVYEGQFKDDKKHGDGIFTYNDGLIVEGVWENDELIEGSKIERYADNYNSERLKEASSQPVYSISLRSYRN